MSRLAEQWGVLKSNGATFRVLLRDDSLANPFASGSLIEVSSPTGDLDRLDSLTDARVRLASGAELTLDEQTRTRLAGGRTAAVFAVARSG